MSGQGFPEYNKSAKQHLPINMEPFTNAENLSEKYSLSELISPQCV
jgi:hypothetical protein